MILNVIGEVLLERKTPQTFQKPPTLQPLLVLDSLPAHFGQQQRQQEKKQEPQRRHPPLRPRAVVAWLASCSS